MMARRTPQRVAALFCLAAALLPILTTALTEAEQAMCDCGLLDITTEACQVGLDDTTAGGQHRSMH